MLRSANSVLVFVRISRVNIEEMGGCTKPSRNSGADRTMQRRMGNLTFEQYCESHPDFKTTGEGCRITPAWKTKSTQADIRLKIEEFWDTRTSGDPMMWRTLRSACEAPDASKP